MKSNISAAQGTSQASLNARGRSIAYGVFIGPIILFACAGISELVNVTQKGGNEGAYIAANVLTSFGLMCCCCACCIFKAASAASKPASNQKNPKLRIMDQQAPLLPPPSAPPASAYTVEKQLTGSEFNV